MEIAKTIIQQLGGAGRLQLMTGANMFVALKDGVAFKIKNRKVNYIKIILNGKDLYDVYFYKLTSGNLKLISEHNDIYFDQLIPLFEKETGMYLTLFAKGGRIKKDERTEMILSQLRQIHHHEEELREIIKKDKSIEPWVIAKIQRAVTDLGDVTHYEDGKVNVKFAKGSAVQEKKSLGGFVAGALVGAGATYLVTKNKGKQEENQSAEYELQLTKNGVKQKYPPIFSSLSAAKKAKSDYEKIGYTTKIKRIYAKGGGIEDDITRAKSDAIDKIDFEYYAKQYAGDSWEELSEKQKAELMSELRENWFNNSYGKGGTIKWKTSQNPNVEGFVMKSFPHGAKGDALLSRDEFIKKWTQRIESWIGVKPYLDSVKEFWDSNYSLDFKFKANDNNQYRIYSPGESSKGKQYLIQKYNKSTSKMEKGGGIDEDNWIYWKLEKNGKFIYDKTHPASPNIPKAKQISKKEYETNTKKMAKGGGVDEIKVGDKLSIDGIEYIFISKEKIESKIAPNHIEYRLSPVYAKDKPLIIDFRNDKDFNQWIKTKKMADGGRIDLFEDYENIPPKVQKILDKYAKKFGEDLGEMDYSDMADMHKEIVAVGYTFESGLDNMPYGLRPLGVNLNELQGYEDEDDDDKMAKGGEFGQGLGYQTEYQNDELYQLYYSLPVSKLNYQEFYKKAKLKGYSDFEIDEWYENRNDDDKMAKGGEIKEYYWKNSKYGTSLFLKNKYQGVSINKTKDKNYIVTADEGYRFYKDFEPTHVNTIAEGKKYALKEISYTLKPQFAKGGDIDNESGLMVTGRTPLDNHSIGILIEENDYHAEWNPREGYWFFPEDVESYDALEKQLQDDFYRMGISARFEGIFDKGGNIELDRKAQKFLDTISIADRSIELKDIKVEATPRGNWVVYHKGKKLMNINSSQLDEDTIKKYDLEYHEEMANGGGLGSYKPLDKYDRIKSFMLNLGFEVEDIQPTDTSVGIFDGWVVYKKRDSKSEKYYSISYDDLWYYLNNNGSKQDIVKDSEVVDEDFFAKGGNIYNYLKGTNFKYLNELHVIKKIEPYDNYTILVTTKNRRFRLEMLQEQGVKFAEKPPRKKRQPLTSEELKYKNAQKIRELQRERKNLLIDMEQEAEPEGGPIANRYGRMLNSIDKRIAKLSGQDYFSKGGGIASFKKGDKVKTRYGKVETILRKNKNGNYETEENEYTHAPETLTLVEKANKRKK